jgi:hypothetical protein
MLIMFFSVTMVNVNTSRIVLKKMTKTIFMLKIQRFTYLHI